MIIPIQAGGDVAGYASGRYDIHGQRRDVYPVPVMWGRPAAMQAYLLSLAPATIRPRHYQWPDQVAGRPRTGFARHCEQHVYHVMVCFSEPHDHIVRCLPVLTRGAEDLLNLGLPPDALKFTWWRHDKQHGTHAHGALLRTLPEGPHYELNLAARLLFLFCRLASFHFGFTDPEHPAGFRPLYAGWVSATPQNSADIDRICQLVTARFDANSQFARADLLQLFADLKLAVLVTPDKTGQPIRSNIEVPEMLRVPHFRNTFVVASQDRSRIIVFKGPLARPEYNPAAFREERERREQVAWDLPKLMPVVREEFKTLVVQRQRQQQERYGIQGETVGLEHFMQLLPPVAAGADPIADPLIQFPPYLRWSERRFPFATETDLTLAGVLPPGRLVSRSELAALSRQRREEEEQVNTIWNRRRRQLERSKRRPERSQPQPAPVTPGPDAPAGNTTSTAPLEIPPTAAPVSETTAQPTPPGPANSIVFSERLKRLAALANGLLASAGDSDLKEDAQKLLELLQTRPSVVWCGKGYHWYRGLIRLRGEKDANEQEVQAVHGALLALQQAAAAADKSTPDLRPKLLEVRTTLVGLKGKGEELDKQMGCIAQVVSEFESITGHSYSTGTPPQGLKLPATDPNPILTSGRAAFEKLFDQFLATEIDPSWNQKAESEYQRVKPINSAEAWRNFEEKIWEVLLEEVTKAHTDQHELGAKALAHVTRLHDEIHMLSQRGEGAVTLPKVRRMSLDADARYVDLSEKEEKLNQQVELITKLRLECRSIAILLAMNRPKPKSLPQKPNPGPTRPANSRDHQPIEKMVESAARPLPENTSQPAPAPPAKPPPTGSGIT